MIRDAWGDEKGSFFDPWGASDVSSSSCCVQSAPELGFQIDSAYQFSFLITCVQSSLIIIIMFVVAFVCRIYHQHLQLTILRITSVS